MSRGILNGIALQSGRIRSMPNLPEGGPNEFPRGGSGRVGFTDNAAETPLAAPAAVLCAVPGRRGGETATAVGGAERIVVVERGCGAVVE